MPDQNKNNSIISNDPALVGYTDQQSNNINEYDADTPDTPDKLKDTQRESEFTDWKNEPSIRLLKEDLEYARQENLDQAANVEGWLAIRNTTGSESGSKFKKPGRSTVQPKLVRKHNEWRYPALSEPFLNSDRVFDVEPRTFEDQDAAKQNQLLLNWQFDTKIRKVDFIDRYVRKTVDEGTCIVRIGWNRKTQRVTYDEPVYDYFEITEQEQYSLLLQMVDLYQNEDPQYDRLPGEIKAAVEYYIEKEVPVYAVQNGTKEITKDKVIENHPTIKIVNVTNFFIDPSCEGVWSDAKFMISTYESTRSDLKKRRIFKNLDKVNWTENAIQHKSGEQDHSSTTPQDDVRTTNDKSKVLVYEYWGEYDIHKTGEMVPIVVVFIGDTIIQMSENPFPDKKPPFILVPYMPILDSSFGEADASILHDNQRIIGATYRGIIDLLGRSANSQTGYAKNFLDPVNRTRFNKGEDFEYNPNSDPRLAVQQMKYPEIPQSALTLIGMNNQESEALSGVKSFDSGINSSSFGNVARGISSANDAAGQRELSIVRRLAEGIRQIGIKFTAMNAMYMTNKEVIRVTNQKYVEISKDDIQGNFDLKVDVSTQASDEAKANDLGFMLQTTGPDMEPGLRGIILAEIAELKRMPTLAERIRSYQPEPDPLEQQQRQLEIEKLQTDIALNEARTQEALARADHTENDTILERDGIRHERAVQTQGAQARGNRDLEVTKSLLGGETPSGNIEAAVGFNEIVKENDNINTQPQFNNIPADALNPSFSPIPLNNSPQPIAF